MSAVTSKIAATLKLVPWLKSCGQPFITDLATHTRPLSLHDNEAIALRGRSLENLIVVAEGKLVSSMTNRAGKNHIVGHLHRGQVFGLIPTLDGATSIHDVRSNGDSAVLLIPRDIILQALKTNHELVLGLVGVLCDRSRRLYEFLADQSLLSLSGRVMSVLLSVLNETAVYQIGKATRAAPLTDTAEIVASQSVLSDMLGVTRQSLNAELKKLEAEGLIKVQYSRISLLDIPRMSKLLEEA